MVPFPDFQDGVITSCVWFKDGMVPFFCLVRGMRMVWLCAQLTLFNAGPTCHSEGLHLPHVHQPATP